MPPSKNDVFETLQQLQKEYTDTLPPVEQWNPELSGDIDIRIDREGHWYHEGELIQRSSLVKLFSSILKHEDNDYFLVTPVEKWRIQVDVSPFVFVQLSRVNDSDQSGVLLTTQTGVEVLLSAENPFWMGDSSDGQPQPMAKVHGNLNGLLNRNVFYELVEMCQLKTGVSGEEELIFNSAGCAFSLGRSGAD